MIRFTFSTTLFLFVYVYFYRLLVFVFFWLLTGMVRVSSGHLKKNKQEKENLIGFSVLTKYLKKTFGFFSPHLLPGKKNQVSKETKTK